MIVVTAVSFICYLITGLVQSALIMLPAAILLMVCVLLVIRRMVKSRQA